MQRDDIAHSQQLAELVNLSGIAQRQFILDIVKIDVHAQAFRQHAKLHTDVAIADDAELFAARFIGANRQLVPDTAVRLGVRFRNTAQQQQQLADHQFCNRSGIRERCIKHRNTALRRSVEINLVGADAEAANRHQFFCRRENFFRQLRARTDTDEMRIAN